LAVSLSVPALFELAPHFLIGIGPSVTQDIVHTEIVGPQMRQTSYGASTVIGGWL
jgi:hypothetical protein